MDASIRTGSLVVYLASFAFHVVGGLVLSFIEAPEPEEVTVVELSTIERPEKEEEPEPEPEPEPLAAPEPQRPTPQPAPSEAPPPPPDFGFVVSQGPGGPGGVSVPVPPPATVRQEARTLQAAAPKSSGCDEEIVKAKPLAVVGKPAYTDEARAAGIEGKVRVELTLDESGGVTKAVVLKGLGYGLDEAAIAAAQNARFKPATRCGKPVSATFVVAFTFVL